MTTGNGIPILRSDGIVTPRDRASAGRANLVSRGLETLANGGSATSVVDLPECSHQLQAAILLQARGHTVEAATTFSDLAATGDAEALWWYALALHHNWRHDGSENHFLPDLDVSVDSLSSALLQSAERGYVPAQAWFAEESCWGTLLPESWPLAFKWATRAANAGSCLAMHTLSDMHMLESLPKFPSYTVDPPRFECDAPRGQELTYHAAEWKRWAELAAQSGGNSGGLPIARTYEREGEYEKAARWYLSGALAGDEISADHLGALLQSKQCIEILPADPEYWYRHALLSLRLNRQIIPNTVGWLKNKAAQGDQFAIDALDMNESVADHSQSPVYQANALKLAYDESAAAQRAVALFSTDESAKIYWFGRAADLGDHPSMYALALLKMKRAYGSAEIDDSVALLRKAANLGNKDAQKKLAEHFAVGHGGSSSAMEAVYWARQYVIDCDNSKLPGVA